VTAAPEDRQIERHQKLSRLGCLGVVVAVLIFFMGGGLFAFGQDAADRVLMILGIILMGIAFVAGLLSSALNVTTFGTYLAKRAQRAQRDR
jgi:cytochrome b subunit of formate dehydrogenase